MSQFEREMPPFRLADTDHGDTLQIIAAREMGDANRWAELVWINSLTHPYLTDDPDLSSNSVLLTGSLIKVPAPSNTPVEDSGRAQVFGRDVLMRNKKLVVEGGDFSVASGVDNLKQQITHAITTPRGQMLRHINYGCLVWRLLGTVGGPTAGMLGAKYVSATIGADYRVNEVISSVATISGDKIEIKARCESIDGGAVDIEIERQGS